MHSNFKITNVRFYVDNQKTKLEGVTEPIYPMQVHNEERVQSWNRFALNRFTFPRTRRMDVIVPFSEMKAEGKSGPGVVVGKLDVEIDHVGSVHRHSGLGGQEMSRENVQVIPFEIRLK